MFTQIHVGWLILAVILFMVAAFLTGYTMAETRERHAHRSTMNAYHAMQRSKRELTTWVHDNWPDEFTAYREGHKVGYQQGVLQGPLLDEEDVY